jgi:hypothetical protein
VKVFPYCLELQSLIPVRRSDISHSPESTSYTYINTTLHAPSLPNILTIRFLTNTNIEMLSIHGGSVGRRYGSCHGNCSRFNNSNIDTYRPGGVFTPVDHLRRFNPFIHCPGLAICVGDQLANVLSMDS